MKMNVDAILESFARHEVDAILIGGMNFLLRHKPVLTYDVDLWVQDTDENLAKVAEALRDLGAEWGRDDSSWKPVPTGFAWLRTQTIFCLTSAHGAIDIFREVEGLYGQYRECRNRCTDSSTASGIPYASLANEDMLACQLALPAPNRNSERIAFLQSILRKSP